MSYFDDFTSKIPSLIVYLMLSLMYMYKISKHRVIKEHKADLTMLFSLLFMTAVRTVPIIM